MIMALLGIEHDVLDLSDNPLWRAHIALLNQAADARLRAERLEAQARAQLEAVAVATANPPKRRRASRVIAIVSSVIRRSA